MGGKGQKIFYLFPVVEGLGPWGWFLYSVLLSDRMYLGHMCTGNYWLIRVATMVSADLLGMVKTSSHPVRWLIMVRICLLPEVEVSQSVAKSIAILSNGLSGISVICNGYCWTLALSCLHKDTVGNVFLDVFIHAFPVILVLDEAICVGISLMT